MTDRFEGFFPETIDYFVNIRLNNNKPWYEEHKEQFGEYCKRPFALFSAELAEHIGGYLPDMPLKAHVSRIYKDMRHFHGGDRYNDHLWVSARPYDRDWQHMPVFWFGLSPEGYDYGMGYFDTPRDLLQLFRERIDANPQEFRNRVVTPMQEQSVFRIGGECYKRKMADHPEEIMRWYQLKSIHVINERPLGGEIFSREIMDRVKSDFDSISSVYKYLMELHP